MATSKRKSDCAINFVLELFGDRWSLLIVRDLMFQGKHYYGEFLQSEEKISTNILADRLSLLERQGIVTKNVDPKHRSKNIYKLSAKGIDLLPVLIEFIIWSAKYDKYSGVDREFIKHIKRDREGVLKKVSNRLKKELAE